MKRFGLIFIIFIFSLTGLAFATEGKGNIIILKEKKLDWHSSKTLCIDGLMFVSIIAGRDTGGNSIIQVLGKNGKPVICSMQKTVK